nr:vegetative incompatibility protein het-e-1 [Quercus suber]
MSHHDKDRRKASSPQYVGNYIRLSSPANSSMRLLKRDHAGGVGFTPDLSDSEASKLKYAILSHTWGADGDEVSFDDIIAGTGTSKPSYEKIRFCLRQTEQDDLEYFWLDTCCIDKNNLPELSKSLISMFRWYAGAERCYVFLSDVPRGLSSLGERYADVSRLDDFQSSRWFRRGWTLQELLAPKRLEIFSRYGQCIGTKDSLERQLNDITGLPVRALHSQSFDDFSVQEVFQWQHGRETKVEEDLIYSLLGIFDISMPILYGEGRSNARKRLEIAIISSRREAVETEHFVARDLELRQMRDSLHSDGRRKTVVLCGLGGIGKTQLAIAYAMRHRDNYSALCWLNCKDENSVKSSFVRISKQILREHANASHLINVNMQNLDEVVTAVKAWLSMPMNTRWLMVCDNYDNPKLTGNHDPAALDLRLFLPEAHQDKTWPTVSEHDRMLEKLSHMWVGPGAVRLARQLDGLPLALATAGACLSQNSMSFDRFLDVFEHSWDRLQQIAPAPMTYDRTLFSTWQVSFEQIKRRNILAANLLRWWAYFDNQDLWFELLHHNEFGAIPKWIKDLTSDELSFRGCMQILCEHGLVEANNHREHDIESTGYSVHPCVHTWMRAVLNVQRDDQLARAALLCVAGHVPHRHSLGASHLQRRILSHAVRCASYFPSHLSYGSAQNYAFHVLGMLYCDLRKLPEAEDMFLRALTRSAKSSKKNSEFVLDLQLSLGTLYLVQGRMLEAEEVHMQALQGSESYLGPLHRVTLAVLNNLGVLYTRLQKPEQAEEMLMRSRRRYESLKTPETPSSLEPIHNLGRLYFDQGRMAEAEALYKQVVEGKTQAMGPDHPSMLSAIQNLGIVYREQRRVAEAKVMYERALVGRQKAFGADHQSTLSVVVHLGTLYLNQGQLAEATKMYERALSGITRTLGMAHPSIPPTVIVLGILYTQIGEVAKAEEMYHHANASYDRLTFEQQRAIGVLRDLCALHVYDTNTSPVLKRRVGATDQQQSFKEMSSAVTPGPMLGADESAAAAIDLASIARSVYKAAPRSLKHPRSVLPQGLDWAQHSQGQRLRLCRAHEATRQHFPFHPSARKVRDENP